jgi:ParB-like chromosome segregation protein Spo0J
LHSDYEKRNDGREDGFRCQLIPRPLHELRPHFSYTQHQLSVSASQLSLLASLGCLAFREPIVITRNGIIIDGYARWELARRQGRQTILCLEYDVTDEEALRWLIQSHRPSRGLNAYSRILLALDLEPFLQEQARANQRAGGQNKNSSDLTEADRLDVRSEIAAVAGVSTGNVTKTKQLRKTAHPRVEKAVRTGEISIHKAWQWSRSLPQQQARHLEEYQSRKGTNQTSWRRIQKHVARLSPTQLIPPSLGDLLKPIVSDRSAALDSIVVTEVDAPGCIAYLTKAALFTLRSIKESKCPS